MQLTILLLLLNALSLMPLVEAWTLVWRNASDTSFVEHAKTSMSCTKISNPKGKLFEYDSEEGPFEISLYGNKDCSGVASGWASHMLSKNASAAINSFRVDSSATTASSPVATTSSSTSIQPAASTTLTDTLLPESGSGTGLSGGSIAGIVIGVVAGVAIIGGILFFIGRRRWASSQNPVLNMGYAPSGCGSPDTYTSPSSLGRKLASLDSTKNQTAAPSSTQGSSNAPVRVVELPGDYNPAELSNSNTRTELEGQIRSPVSPS